MQMPDMLFRDSYSRTFALPDLMQLEHSGFEGG